MIEGAGALPFVGAITKYQPAKNFGVSVVKPDLHLCRLAGIHRTERLLASATFSRLAPTAVRRPAAQLCELACDQCRAENLAPDLEGKLDYLLRFFPPRGPHSPCRRRQHLLNGKESLSTS